MIQEKLTRDFYERDTLLVARELLGMYLVHNSEEGRVVGKVVETEAYIGPDDAASHGYRNRMTKRNRVMFGPAGYAYIYQIYGMYFCLNVVSGKIDVPEAVLIRGAEPVEGIEIMAQRRGLAGNPGSDPFRLTNGPSKLCRAFALDVSQSGVDLCGDELFFTHADSPETFEVKATPRINVDYAGVSAYLPWRFIVVGNRFVTPHKFNRLP
jgi:DNA-3-methyladenine glycosylase